MSAGLRIYSFDWAVFDDLTSNTASTIPAAVADALLDGKTARKIGLPAKLPKTRDALSARVSELFLKPEWYVGQPAADVTLRHTLLFGMFFEKSLKAIGLSATQVDEECSSNLAAVLSGRATLNLEHMRRNKGMFIKYLVDAQPGDNAFWWLGSRPFRYKTWTGSKDDSWDFAEEYEHEAYSIQSPSYVHSLAHQLDEQSAGFQSIACEELHEALACYRHCIDRVKAKNAGMLVEHDT